MIQHAQVSELAVSGGCTRQHAIARGCRAPLYRISTSELDRQSCALLFFLNLFGLFVYVRLYVSVCSFALFSFELLVGGRFL